MAYLHAYFDCQWDLCIVFCLFFFFFPPSSRPRAQIMSIRSSWAVFQAFLFSHLLQREIGLESWVARRHPVL